MADEPREPTLVDALAKHVDTSMTVRVVKLSRNTGWGEDPELSYRLRPGEQILSASHRYGNGNFEGLTLIVLGLTRDLPDQYKKKEPGLG